MNNEVARIESSIKMVEAQLYGCQQRLSDLKAQREEALKPKFKPFDLTLRVETIEQAKTLRALHGRCYSVAQHLAHNCDDALLGATTNQARSALAKLFAPMDLRFNYRKKEYLG